MDQKNIDTVETAYILRDIMNIRAKLQLNEKDALTVIQYALMEYRMKLNRELHDATDHESNYNRKGDDE